MIALLAALALGQPAIAEGEPSDHTLIYYNARLALREDRPLEAAKLWLLRNALEDRSGRVSPYDADFRSVTWAALGELGICQDGHREDTDGAGLWPLGLHNWVVRNRGNKTRAKKPRPFDAFQVGRQQRFVSIGDVLSADEIRSVALFRGACVRPRVMLIEQGEKLKARISDPQVAARLLIRLLERARITLRPDVVRGMSVIEARLFDLRLQQAELAAREARREALERSRKGRELGLSRESVADLVDQAPTTTLDPQSEAARILRRCVDWPASEWMALSPDRRLFLYDQARAFGGDPEKLDQIALGVIDLSIARGEGVEVDRWIAHRSGDPAVQEPIWGGERGQALLALDRESGFTERSVIALHRGVQQLQGGDLPGSLRSIAYALQKAPESRSGEAVAGLSLRWLSYVASQFELTDELLVTLQELVPQREYGVLLEDLMWGAAMRADRTSFERGVHHQAGRGALSRRITLLGPLARGDLGGFTGPIRDGLASSPSETMRFLDQFVERLEREDAAVRAAQVPTLVRLRELVGPLTGEDGRQGRVANDWMDRTQAILEGVGGLGSDASSRDRARALGPGSEVFAGAVRLAPSDALPWPFRASVVAAPSVFEPLDLTPVEWRDASGGWVFGWSLGG